MITSTQSQIWLEQILSYFNYKFKDETFNNESTIYQTGKF